MKALDRIEHSVDICVVGGGLAGLCAALAAARHGARVLLMHERPVLGGNASSEIRVHICGADRAGSIPFLRETGILEEVRLENLRRNPNHSYSIWDTVLYEKAMLQPRLTTLLNCSCADAATDGERISSVTGWQQTTQTWHTVAADVFVDCSGDAILAPLTGALYRVGREGRGEYGESIAPEQPDHRTMGMTCLFQARKYDSPQPFAPLPWAYTFERDEEIPYGERAHRWLEMGYWWVELGGEYDSIRDTEKLRHELLRIVFGLWDHIKNRGDHGAENWALEWIQFLPGKRESRRYIGDHVLTQLDIESEGKFADLVAYGGWSMDDHHPAGFWAVKSGAPATIFHPAPSPYGIPYRALYSRNVANLMFAGRCASCTHAAMSSTRVMGTAASMGQAVGVAAAIAARRGVAPRGVGEHIEELQQTLLHDDCYLPGVVQGFGELTKTAKLVASQGDPEPLRDGVNRPIGENPHCWPCRAGDSVTYQLARPRPVDSVTLILDSALDKAIRMSRHDSRERLAALPPSMPKEFRIEGREGGEWQPLVSVEDNGQRLVRFPIQRTLDAIRFALDRTWGGDSSRVYAFYLD